jgi:hypothetical protein
LLATEEEKLLAVNELIERYQFDVTEEAREVLFGAYDIKLDLLLQQDNAEEALALLESLPSDVRRGDYALLQASLLVTQGDSEAAINVSVQAIEEHGYSVSTLTENYLLMSEEEQEAYYANELPELLEIHAAAQYALGEEDAAREVWQHLYHSTENTEYLHKIGHAYRQEGNFEASQNFYRQQLSVNENFYIRSEMAINEMLLGSPSNARALRDGLQPMNSEQQILAAYLDQRLGLISQTELDTTLADIALGDSESAAFYYVLQGLANL